MPQFGAAITALTCLNSLKEHVYFIFRGLLTCVSKIGDSTSAVIGLTPSCAEQIDQECSHVGKHADNGTAPEFYRGRVQVHMAKLARKSDHRLLSIFLSQREGVKDKGA